MADGHLLTGRLSFVSRARRLSHFVVRMRSSVLSLRVRVNVTAGSLRAVYLKHETCALYPEDIAGRQCDAVTNLCHMTWCTSPPEYAKPNTACHGSH